jgi:predicted DCC family thiol-disulfide oxidoreductase YuxK
VLTLTVLYDARCDLCCRIRAWLQSQTKYVELAFIPAGSDAARHRFPQLDHAITLTELTIISSRGEVYRGAKAWLMCLWALREYRAWSLRLASPELMPIARRLIARVSSQRFKLGHYRWLLGKES